MDKCHWKPVVFAAECEPCPDCDDLICTCGKHYADCDCPGPSEDGVEYSEANGVLYGRKSVISVESP
jgi:hypothetical protein